LGRGTVLWYERDPVRYLPVAAAAQPAQPLSALPVWQGGADGLLDVFFEEFDVDEYPSAYQPPPFNWNEDMDINFFTCP